MVPRHFKDTAETAINLFLSTYRRGEEGNTSDLKLAILNEVQKLVGGWKLHLGPFVKKAEQIHAVFASHLKSCL